MTKLALSNKFDLIQWTSHHFKLSGNSTDFLWLFILEIFVRRRIRTFLFTLRSNRSKHFTFSINWTSMQIWLDGTYDVRSYSKLKCQILNNKTESNFYWSCLFKKLHFRMFSQTYWRLKNDDLLLFNIDKPIFWYVISNTRWKQKNKFVFY